MPKTDISIRELVGMVTRGDLLLPEMQRRYIWPASRVRDLLDSLYRGYPSGTILVWESGEKIPTRETAIETTQQPINFSVKKYLLDGQQRITSIAAIMTGKPVKVRGRSRPVEILFNLEHPEGPPLEVIEVEEESNEEKEALNSNEEQIDPTEQFKKFTFIVASRRFSNKLEWIPVSEIFTKTDREILIKRGLSATDKCWDKYSDRLQKVRKIGDYQYVMQVLEHDKNYEEVTQIFVRVNSKGVKLRSSDLALAQITSKWKGFTKELEEFAKELGEDDFWLDSGILIRCLTVTATGQSRFQKIGKLDLDQLKEAWSKAKNGIYFSNDFLKSNAKISSLQNLSSPFLLVPILFYYLIKEGKITTEEEKLLRQWVFYAHMWGHYSGSSETVLDNDLNILRKTKSLQELLKQLSSKLRRLEVFPQDVQGKSTNSPFFTMLYFILKEDKVKDWESGLAISEHKGRKHKIQFHHIFPKALLKNSYERQEINEIANIAFIGGGTNLRISKQEPIKYLETFQNKYGKGITEEQLIPSDKDLWRLENYKKFLTWRREKIADKINNFMDRI